MNSERVGGQTISNHVVMLWYKFRLPPTSPQKDMLKLSPPDAQNVTLLGNRDIASITDEDKVILE